MLATGGSAVRACEIIKAAGVPRLKLLSLIAAPEGIARMNRAMPDVPIHVGAVDERLNEVGFIYPGLGDAGDRQFGTGTGPRPADEPCGRDRAIPRERGFDRHASRRHHSQEARWACPQSGGDRRDGRGNRDAAKSPTTSGRRS